MTLGGRLSGAVTARSGERPSQTVLRRFMPASTLTTINPSNLQLSRSAITDAASLLGGYVVYMEVGGTVESPAVRLQTVRTLSEAAVRFFLFRFMTPTLHELVRTRIMANSCPFYGPWKNRRDPKKPLAFSRTTGYSHF